MPYNYAPNSPGRPLPRVRDYREPDVLDRPLKVPTGAPPGGQYVEVRYFGPTSGVLCILGFFVSPLCLVPLCCPCDNHLVYMAPDGTCYDPDVGGLVAYFDPLPKQRR